MWPHHNKFNGYYKDSVDNKDNGDYSDGYNNVNCVRNYEYENFGPNYTLNNNQNSTIATNQSITSTIAHANATTKKVRQDINGDNDDYC